MGRLSFIISGDLLENYCWDDDLMNFSRILFSATILLTYPIECFVTRDVIEHAFIKEDPNVPMSEKTHYVITLVIVSVAYFISMATDCLGVVLELNVSAVCNYKIKQKDIMVFLGSFSSSALSVRPPRNIVLKTRRREPFQQTKTTGIGSSRFWESGGGIWDHIFNGRIR